MEKKNPITLSFILLLICAISCDSSRDADIFREKKGIVTYLTCWAKPGLSNQAYKKAIDFYCKQPGVDCSVIQPGGTCFQPNTLVDHASVVVNQYYRAHKKHCPTDVGFLFLSTVNRPNCII